MEKSRSVNQYRSLPFWSWNDELDEEKLCKQIEWMKENDFGGFFMHARSGLKTEYLGKKWFSCVKACVQKAKELGMQAWAYDENGWPSGIAGGKMLKNTAYFRKYLDISYGKQDESADVSYDISGETLVRLSGGEACENCLNIYIKTCETSVDITDETVVAEFLQETHERYVAAFDGKLSDNIKGFFTDEPTYSHYPNKIADYFKEHYGEDVLDGLGLLYVEKKGYRAFRYKYYLALATLFRNNYVKQIYDWCEKYGVQSTGHFVEEAGIFGQMLGCLGVMPLYEFMHMPGIDWLCRRFINISPIKQLVSVCAQLGKRKCITESFAMTGWDVTPLELKAIAQFQYMYGINVTSQHLVPYTETGWRKNDHPLHFTPDVPWINGGMGKLNATLDALGDWVENSEEKVRVAVLHPIRSAYGCFERACNPELGNLDENFRNFSDMLADKQVAFHYVDESILENHGGVQGNTLICGKCKYTCLIIPPKLSTMGKYTEKCIRQFIANGGKLWVAEDGPCYLEGEDYDFSYMQSNVTLDDIVAMQEYFISYMGGTLRSVCRSQDGKKVIMLLNTHTHETANVQIKVDGKKLQRIDGNGKGIYCDGTYALPPHQSAFFLVCDRDGEKVSSQKTVTLSDGAFTVTDCTDNAFVLDRAQMSLDGENYSSEYPLEAIFENLNKQRYIGDLYLRYRFAVQKPPKTIALAYEKTQESAFAINGKTVVLDGVLQSDAQTAVGDIAPYIQCGENVIVQKLHYFQSDEVYGCLHGFKKTAMTMNTIVYDTYLESLRLLGKFGVYSDKPFENSSMENVVFGQDFYLSNLKTQICDLLKDGYPFFAGKMCLQTELDLDETDVALKITGRTHYVRAFVNGVYVGEYLFDNVLDISKAAKKGKNTVLLEMYTGNRNLFGPFHLKNAEESFYVTPDSYAMRGWDGFTHKNYRDSYSFVRTGIFACDGQFRLPAMDK